MKLPGATEEDDGHFRWSSHCPFPSHFPISKSCYFHFPRIYQSIIYIFLHSQSSVFYAFREHLLTRLINSDLWSRIFGQSQSEIETWKVLSITTSTDVKRKDRKKKYYNNIISNASIIRRWSTTIRVCPIQRILLIRVSIIYLFSCRILKIVQSLNKYV